MKPQRPAERSSRLVVYTAIFGGYEGLLPQKPIPGVDFVCFTDRDLAAKPWRIVKSPAGHADPTRCARRRKVLAHEYLDDYDTSIWIDGNFLVVGDVRRLVEERLVGCTMLIYDHGKTEGDPRTCVYEEYEAIMRMGRATGEYKDDPGVMEAQIERYRREGYPPDNGLIYSAVLVRRHHEPDVMRAMNTWWREIEAGSRRDQLSFNYAAWKEGLRLGWLEGNVRDNRWFYQIGIHRRDYRMKLLRYRLRRWLGLRKHA